MTKIKKNKKSRTIYEIQKTSLSDTARPLGKNSFINRSDIYFLLDAMDQKLSQSKKDLFPEVVKD
ncbi:hypothetical protein EGX73_08770 [Enterococcus sp. FDAARGOS_553]|nr:hypothetical protein EGX73_08770 [Enterococcus sp. FDAARGOS_553]